jgi:hypothetical protein
MNEPRRTYDRSGPRQLSPGLRNSLDTENDMMGIGPLLLFLGLATVILIVIAVLFIASW